MNIWLLIIIGAACLWVYSAYLRIGKVNGVKQVENLPRVLDFSPYDFNLDQIDELILNDWIKFWVKPDKSAVYIYRRDGYGGDGYLGKVPPEYTTAFTNYIEVNKKISNRITHIGVNTITIQCTFKSWKK